MSYVGYKQLSSVEELKVLLTQKYQQPSYYFLRWAHEVSGIVTYLPPNFPSPEGQMFNAELEIRWQQQGQGYTVLLLSQDEPDAVLGFQAIPGDWETLERNAYFYDVDETQFPKGFIYEDEQGNKIDPKTIPLAQRYFRDARTSMVHFVALTLGNQPM